MYYTFSFDTYYLKLKYTSSIILTKVLKTIFKVFWFILTIVKKINAFSCQCMQGFTGRYCESETNECWSDPCLNEAVCEDSINSYRCKCAGGWEGENCEWVLH